MRFTWFVPPPIRHRRFHTVSPETRLVRRTVLACMLPEGIGNSGSVSYRRYVLLDLPAFPTPLQVTASTIDRKSIVVPVAHGGSFKMRPRLDQKTDQDKTLHLRKPPRCKKAPVP